MSKVYSDHSYEIRRFVSHLIHQVNNQPKSMPKMKTQKSVSSRIKKTKSGKFRRRRAGQGHFNSRDTGKAKRRKRRDFTVSKSETKALKQLMPHS